MVYLTLENSKRRKKVINFTELRFFLMVYNEKIKFIEEITSSKIYYYNNLENKDILKKSHLRKGRNIFLF